MPGNRRRPDRFLHVVPIDDLKPHEASPGCWCRPTPDREEPTVLVHHAADLREDIEKGRVH